MHLRLAPRLPLIHRPPAHQPHRGVGQGEVSTHSKWPPLSSIVCGAGLTPVPPSRPASRPPPPCAAGVPSPCPPPSPTSAPSAFVSPHSPAGYAQRPPPNAPPPSSS